MSTRGAGRASELRERLRLLPHPEGGHDRDVHRSGEAVHPAGRSVERSAITHIYFLLIAGERSRWHRVSSDEVWSFYEGDPLELFWLEPGEAHLSRALLAPVGDESQPIATVPAGCWQAARPTGEYSLVGCSVGPGFDFADFDLLDDLPEIAERIRCAAPHLTELL